LSPDDASAVNPVGADAPSYHATTPVEMSVVPLLWIKIARMNDGSLLMVSLFAALEAPEVCVEVA
jgi:hypothetical protein